MPMPMPPPGPPMPPGGGPGGPPTAPFDQEPQAPGLAAGRNILDLSTLPPQVIMILIKLGVLDQSGMPVQGQMDAMEPSGPSGAPGQMPPEPSDPRVLAIQRAIGAGRAQVPNGF